MPATSASAPGKIILCGEHAVVYGTPAIAIPVFQVSTRVSIFAKPTAVANSVHILAPVVAIDSPLYLLPVDHPLSVTIDLVLQEFNINHLPACEIRITSTIPVAAGLGSSASVSVALIRSLSAFLGHPFPDDTVCRLAYEVEKLHHGSPSGIDNTVVTYQQPVYFKRGEPICILQVNSPLNLVVANSGIESSTAQAVNALRERWKADPDFYEARFAQIGELVDQARMLLESGNVDQLGEILTKNHLLLKELSVSSEPLDHLVDIALNAGASGAKLSGGGIGGNILAMVEPGKLERVAQALRDAGAVNVFATTFPLQKDQR